MNGLTRLLRNIDGVVGTQWNVIITNQLMLLPRIHHRNVKMSVDENENIPIVEAVIVPV